MRISRESTMDFTDPAVFSRLVVTDSNGWKTVTLPKGSTLYRADHAGKKEPSVGVPNFFSDKQSIRPYMRGKSEAETVSKYTTTNDVLLFVMDVGNLEAVAGMDKYAEFMNDTYMAAIAEEDGSQTVVIEPSKPLKITKDGKVLNYANRRMAEIVCELGFGGWVALPDTDLRQLNFDVAWFKQTGQLVQVVNPYSPEIVLCDWKKATTGGRKMSRKYCRKTTCKKMGFSQKASCRPYKNCFTRRQGRK